MILSKEIRVLNRGMINTSRGRCMGPIMHTYTEKVDVILSMISQGAKVVEIVDGKEIELNEINFDKDNGGSTKKAKDPKVTFVKNVKVEDVKVDDAPPSEKTEDDKFDIVPPSEKTEDDKFDETVTTQELEAEQINENDDEQDGDEDEEEAKTDAPDQQIKHIGSSNKKNKNKNKNKQKNTTPATPTVVTEE